MQSRHIGFHLQYSLLISVLIFFAFGCNGAGGSEGGGSGNPSAGSAGSENPGNLGSQSDNDSANALAFETGPQFTQEGAGSGNNQNDGGGVGVTIAKIHNPEPSTMLLMGSGLAALRFYRKKFENK